ncbi:uncharacterized protein LOC129595117 [Paramacrobiotus metropolitanus]|uniref:uncharacterized protein LOC129595117 n=1 Tax=Paramacrobiotus metropolitanus TaxID=2943436 RepID=UPI0024462C0B|nr:uncharacterized protein LOC129595117 [Paramacrobiotus metropolitanus]
MAGLFGNKKKPKEKIWYENNNRTYYGIPGETKDFVLGFTLEIIQTVCAGPTEQGGFFCNLRHMNHREREFMCFISTSAFHKESQFLNEISFTEGMPPVDATNMTIKLLGSYYKWKNEDFVK